MAVIAEAVLEAAHQNRSAAPAVWREMMA